MLRHSTKAIEINSRPERLDPPSALLRLASELGCRSRGHRCTFAGTAGVPGLLGRARAIANGVPAERIVNTWPLDRLLEWSHAKR